MNQTLVGRESEVKTLQKALESSEPEMVAVIGRRRVGKTFLIHSVYGEDLDFEMTGIQNAPLQEQLQNFDQYTKTGFCHFAHYFSRTAQSTQHRSN